MARLVKIARGRRPRDNVTRPKVVDIPSITYLRNALDYGHSGQRRDIDFYKAVRDYILAFQSSDGIQGPDMLQWNNTAHYTGLQEMVRKFLDDDKNGERYWPRDPDSSFHGKLVYEHDSLKIKRAMIQLIFRINQQRNWKGKDGNSRPRKPSGEISFFDDPEPERRILQRGSSVEQAILIDEGEVPAPIAPELGTNNHPDWENAPNETPVPPFLASTSIPTFVAASAVLPPSENAINSIEEGSTHNVLDTVAPPDLYNTPLSPRSSNPQENAGKRPLESDTAQGSSSRAVKSPRLNRSSGRSRRPPSRPGLVPFDWDVSSEESVQSQRETLAETTSRTRPLDGPARSAPLAPMAPMALMTPLQATVESVTDEEDTLGRNRRLEQRHQEEPPLPRPEPQVAQPEGHPPTPPATTTLENRPQQQHRPSGQATSRHQSHSSDMTISDTAVASPGPAPTEPQPRGRPEVRLSFIVKISDTHDRLWIPEGGWQKKRLRELVDELSLGRDLSSISFTLTTPQNKTDGIVAIEDEVGFENLKWLFHSRIMEQFRKHLKLGETKPLFLKITIKPLGQTCLVNADAEDDEANADDMGLFY